ncbi:hypothetical protein P5V15_011538 [Pogonomyrmex californicus]
MVDVQAKIETWTELIQSEKLKDVLKDIKINIHVRPDNKLNDDIFRLLLYLCRTADKCNGQNCETGKDIAKLAKLLCSLLIKVPDSNNFVKAVFKITRCLISFNLYEEAAEICCYLQPGDLYHPQDSTMELLIKVVSLWRVSINNVYNTFTSESLNMENYSKLKSIIKHEMKMTQIAYKNYTRYLIEGICVNLNRLVVIDKDKKYLDDFCKYTLEYLSKTHLYLDKDEKYIIYRHVLGIVCHMTCRTIDTTGIDSVVKILDELSSYFNNLLAEDKECYQCFQQFQNLCMALLVPMENFVNDNAKSIQDIIYCNLNIIKKYGYAGLKWNALTTAELVEPIFTYWETCVDKHTFGRLLDTGILLELMNLFLHINTDDFYSKQVTIKCKWCLGKMCTIKRDLYNAVAMMCRCVNLVCKFPVDTLSAEICAVTRKILKQCVKLITSEMKECECKRWTQSWSTCRNLIYNVGILSEHVYEESIRLFSFLCSCIFQFERIDLNSLHVKSFQNSENIISLVLYRLSIVYYNNSMYRKAMTVCALNALLTCNQTSTKAFYMWTKIKKNASEEIANLTIPDCLRSDKDEIRNELGFSIDISKCDPNELYSREARSLLEERITFTNGVSVVLKKLKESQSNNHYAHILQLLGHYLLDFKHDSSILKYYEEAIVDLKRDKSDSVAVLCLEANFNFFKFVDALHTMNKQTHMEMENTKFALYAPKLPELTETKSPNVVPAYTMINIKIDTTLKSSLQECLSKWKQLFKSHFKEIVMNWEPNLILRLLITAGEYSRLYRYEDCEAEAWTLAYKLALEINDYTVIYITGRCISLRLINYDWIVIAKEHAMKHKDSEDENIIGAIAIFWMSLADLYFECGKYDDAKHLLTKARNLSGISLLKNKPVYLLSLDIIVRNSIFYKDNMQHEDYGSYIVESLLVMRSLNQDLFTTKWKSQAEYLFSFDVIFTMAINLSIRINSLLSFRGISPDLVRLLKSAQSLGAVLRTAELLKSLCYIDLSRSQLDDCEVKLQGLEHMLNIEAFQLSVKSKPVEISTIHFAVTPTKVMDPVRDASQYASPVLDKKVFDPPKFTLHADCDCYKCGNVSYQYLVFATTYIRAQLYALQNHTVAALDHFHGAFEIRRRLFKEEKAVLPDNWPHDEIGVKQFSWQIRCYITDYILLLIDFSYFLKAKIMSKQENVIDITNLAINICCKYKLEGHPVYVMAKELALDNEFQPILESSSECLKFMVPQSYDIDTNDYATIPNDPNVCVTPSVQNRRPKKPLSIRRRRSPKALKITKINMIWSDDEDDDNTSPPPVTYSNKKLKSRTNLIRRKILEEDLTDDPVNLNTEDSMSKEIKSENLDEDKNNTHRKSIKDIMIKVVSLVPDISQNLMNLVDKSDVPVTTENIDKLIEKVESLKINSKTTQRKRSVRDTKQLTVTDYNANINQAIELLKNMAIEEKPTECIDSLTPTKTEKINKLNDQKTPETCNEKKFFKSKTPKESIDKAGPSLMNEHKNARNKCPKLFINNEEYDRRTRSSLKRSQKEKPS